jgi:hypothetical protein
MKKILGLVLLLAPLVGFADDKAADTATLSTTSRAERLNDLQLDQITAGEASTIVIMFNPGSNDTFKVNNNHIVCVNCFGGAVPGETFRVLIVNNPAKSFTK